ncbi:hypothetical protein H4J58_13210 [Colwellia sp. MB3u-70]|uniref:hypothetical protein n=1 Tax=unclassified Colwellia TaxID=196834 RepID=UPI0015F5F28C|nr:MULTISPECIES: hypothetical protein [unclassified Colwellia]MBA6292844.1 hypothetical protein [Colwellia sp. MB3u-8]MBA6308072.1 hypothetical protein [Colwellia sp. MB3u-70]
MASPCLAYSTHYNFVVCNLVTAIFYTLGYSRRCRGRVYVATRLVENSNGHHQRLLIQAISP